MKSINILKRKAQGSGSATADWRISVSATPTNTRCQITELKFLESFAGVGQTVVAPVASAGTPASAFDGNNGTFWDTSFVGGPWTIGGTITGDVVGVSIRVTNDNRYWPTTFALQKFVGGSWVTQATFTADWVTDLTAVFMIAAEAVSGEAAWFGQTIDAGGSSQVFIFAGEHEASPFVNRTGVQINVTHIDLLEITSGASGQLQLALYTDNAGVPDVLLTTTNNVTMANGTNTFTLNTPQNIANGTRIWVAGRIVSGSPPSATGAGGNVGQRYKSAAGAFTNPFGASSGFTNALTAQMRGTVV